MRLRKDQTEQPFAQFQMAVDFTRAFSIRLWLDLASRSILSEKGWSRLRGSRGVACRSVIYLFQWWLWPLTPARIPQLFIDHHPGTHHPKTTELELL